MVYRISSNYGIEVQEAVVVQLDHCEMILFDFASFTENDIQVWTITENFA